MTNRTPTLQDNEGATPLHYAAMCDFEEVASELLKAGADPDIVDADGSTPSDLKPKKWQWLQDPT
jgi:ankyrin repeat protein